MDPKSSLAAVARASTDAAAQPAAVQSAAVQSGATAQPAATSQVAAGAAPAQQAAAAQPAPIAAPAPAAQLHVGPEMPIAAVTAAKQRIAAILALPEAKGREALAQELALGTDLSVDQAKSLLEKSPEAKAGTGFAAAMQAQGNPSLGTQGPAAGNTTGGGDQAVSASWADSIAKANKRFGAQVPTRH